MANKLELMVVPSQITKDAKAFVPVEAFRNLSFWKDLTSDEQKTVQKEGQELAAAMIMGGVSDLSKGEHLTKLHEVLEPKRLFIKFVTKFTRYTPKQAYRLMYGWQNAASRLTEPVLKLAMARNMRIFGDTEEKPLGVYTKAAQVMGPPPKNPDPMQAEKWLDGVEQTMKEQRKKSMSRSKKKDAGAGTIEVTGDPEFMLIESYRFVSKRLKRSGATPKKRVAWLEHLIGLLMTDVGISSKVMYEPAAIPEKFRPNPVGRPSLASKAEEAEEAPVLAFKRG